ncbi:MAG TPA: AAA domain-containing protein [Candidatus Dormibacteraeota bacterium]|nr:AAA domain-containing protein [Candidatus Dormibacteraeota bacterium]
MDVDAGLEDATFDEALGRRISRAVKDWTGQLVDVSGRNTLLCYRALKVGTLDFSEAADVSIDRMLAGHAIRFSDAFGEEALAPAARRGRAIRARAEENFEERGLRTLFAGWGMATWTNTKSTFVPCAPVLLCPAHLTVRGSAAEDFEVSLPGEWEINPTLLHVLANDFEVHIEAESLLELLGSGTNPPDATSLFDRLANEAGRVGGFGIDPRVVLANFSYAKLPMVNDLLAAEDLLARNTLICAIAGDEQARQALRERRGEVSPSAPDFTPPADEYLVLDADSSQSYAINAVVAGADLVIDGPPGTGKSQTIANLIATLSARGKRVLFVAEKRAAIDAVLSRLEKVGLGDLVLDLHDGPGAKGKLAQAFAKTLADAASARRPDMTVAQERLARRREILVRRTAALHEVRQPWGISVYGLQAALTVVPSVQSEQRLGTAALVGLGAAAFRKTEADLEQLVGIGGLTVKASGSPWLSALDAGTITTPDQAAAVMEAMTTFTQHTLPQATARIEGTLSSVGLIRPATVADWARTLELLQRTSRCLEWFEPSVFTLDLDAVLGSLVPMTGGPLGRFWHRLFDGAYRAAVKSLLACTKPSTTLLKGTPMHRAVGQAKELLVDWKTVCTDGGIPRLPGDLEGAGGTYSQLRTELGHLEQALGQNELEQLGSEQLANRLRVFVADRATLYKLPELHRLTVALEGAGLLSLLAEMGHRNLTVDQSVACLRFVWHSSVLDAVSLADPEIGTFDGPAYSRTVAEFRAADARHIETTPARIRRTVAEHMIAVRDAFPSESDLVTHEAGKKRRHVPIRLLFQQAPHVLTALKPCWAMSPLVVSQVLPVEQCFDVVIFDEASQVTPESAAGALMRANQAVVAGDPHQLPPTAFFASGSAVDDEEADELTGSMTKDFESVLDVMGALLPPPIGTKRLDWHYRSRDERLIAFSNAQPQLYDWSLVTFPGAETAQVITHQLVPFVPSGVDQEQSVAHEVTAVVKSVSEHAHDRPHESLGVITMGIKHMERIEEAVRRARQVDPVLEAYLSEVFYGTEKFFVKNLERVQGDERDAILISIGYGKSADGRMLYRFGPLNNAGGERRLNVAVTRARSRIAVISSFSSTDMEPARLKADGAHMLRDYLRYAESGGTDLGERRHERDPLNPFEADVLAQLTAAGLALECQVGCSGYWIDFAAKHPTEPGRYVLAIEADGVMYHSSATARDRDRLRQDHLERLGWRFHRIWSSDWFHHRDREVSATVLAFNEALGELDAPRLYKPVTATEAPPTGPTRGIGDSPSRRRGPKPFRPDGRPITEYYDDDLMRFIKWINSDGQLRTAEEIMSITIAELGYERSSAARREVLGKVIAAYRLATGQDPGPRH